MASAAQTLHIDGDRVLVPASVFDHDGFRRWAKSDAFPERVRATFVAGEVLLETSPETLESHSKVKGAITAALFDFVREHDLGELYPDGVLLTHPEAGLSCEPDLLFITWETFEKDRVRLIERAERKAEYIEIEGTPDLVVEIVSDSSVPKDLVLLRNAYLRAGVPEYWLIVPVTKSCVSRSWRTERTVFGQRLRRPSRKRAESCARVFRSPAHGIDWGASLIDWKRDKDAIWPAGVSGARVPGPDQCRRDFPWTSRIPA